MSIASFGIEISVTENGKRAPQYFIGSDLRGEQSLEDLLAYVKSTLITIAVDTLREEQANGFDKNPLIDVDGVRNKRIDEVNPLGKIQFTARTNSETFLVEAYNLVLSRQPKSQTGTYAKYNWVLYNGALVAESASELATWVKTAELKPNDIIRFINVTPYASRLERLAATQKGGKQRFTKSKDKAQRSGVTLPGNNFKSIAGANGTYYLSARALKRKYAKNAKINFAFFTGNYLNLPAISVPGQAKALRRTYIKTGDNYLYPCIVIRIGDGSGFL